MNTPVNTLWEYLKVRAQKLVAPDSQFEVINDALEDGDYSTVFRETEKIINRSRFAGKLISRPSPQTKFFNSSEEYNNYINRYPSQSFIRWEFPTKPEAHYHRAIAYERTGRLRSSREEIEKSLAEFPDSAKYLVELGYILLNMRYYREGAESFERAILHDLTGDSLYQTKAYMGLGIVGLEQAQFSEARQAFTEARRLTPDHRDVLSHLHLLTEIESDARQRAEYMIGIGNFALAVEAFTEALNINPHDFDMHLGIAFAYKELLKFDLAEKHLKKAFLYNPESSQVNFALGWIYLLQEKPDKAEVEILKAIRKNHYDAGFFVGLSYVYLERFKAGDETSAEKLMAAIRKARELDHNFPEPHLVLAEYYYAADRLEDARTAINAAVKLNPSSQASHVLAAEILLEAGSKKRAEFHLNEASDYGRDTDEIRALRDRLQDESL